MKYTLDVCFTFYAVDSPEEAAIRLANTLESMKAKISEKADAHIEEIDIAEPKKTALSARLL